MSEVREEVEQVFRDVFGEDELAIRDEMTANDIEGWDSTAHVNLIIALESRFKIRFAVAEISRLKEEDQSVGSLVQLIEKKLGRAP